jgi:hypothetical protein
LNHGIITQLMSFIITKPPLLFYPSVIWNNREFSITIAVA